MRDELETPRLLLRRWRAGDLEALAGWHVDPELMRHMPKLAFTREEMEADIERYERHWAEHGFGLWAAEDKEGGTLIASPTTVCGRTTLRWGGSSTPVGREKAWRRRRAPRACATRSANWASSALSASAQLRTPLRAE